jgi:hypothetical protein
MSRLSFTLVVLAITACDNPAPTPTPVASEAPKPVEAPRLAPSASVAPAESAAPARPRRHERRGLAGPMFAALEGLELDAEKKASLDKLEEGLGSAGPADPEEQKALHAAMVEGVKAGKLETSKLEPHLAALDKSAAAHKDAEVKALDGLHKELDSAQRKALVEAVKKRQSEREARWGGREKRDDKDRDAERAKRRLERLARELGLDDDQKKKAEPILAKHDFAAAGARGGPPEEMKKRLDALLTAFEKDAFSAAKLDFGADAKRHREAAKKRAEYLNALLGNIKPEQRDKLAATVEGGPRGGRGRGRGPRGPGPGRGFMPPPGALEDPGDDGDED